MASSNTMLLSDLRDTKLFNDLACQLRMHSLPISLVPYLGVGGSGTLARYKSLFGILTATHVLANHLETREIFAPFVPTENPYTFLNEKVPVKRILFLETAYGIGLLKAHDKFWPDDTLDICFIEIEEEVFQGIIQKSFKKPIDLLNYQKKYSTNFEAYCCANNDWTWAFEGSPRLDAHQNNDNILISRFDGCYLSGGEYVTTPLIHVVPSFDRTADLCIHHLGLTKDLLPTTFGGASGAGVWQVRFEGDNGIVKGIHELFFSGVLVAESQDALMSRGPNSLYDIFLPYLNTLCS